MDHMTQLCVQTKRSRQGKMEKSFLSFAATYSTWEPDAAAKQMLASLHMQSGPHIHGLPDHAPHLLGDSTLNAPSLFLLQCTLLSLLQLRAKPTFTFLLASCPSLPFPTCLAVQLGLAERHE